MADYQPFTGSWAGNVYEQAGWHVVQLVPLDDSHGEPFDLAEALWQLVARPRPRMVLDMQSVAFLSSSLMGILVQLHKRIAMAQGDFHVCNVQPLPLEALHACRLHTVIPLYDNVDAAARYAS